MVGAIQRRIGMRCCQCAQTTFSANREAVMTFSPGLPLRLPCGSNDDISSNRNGCANPAHGETEMPQSLSAVYIHLIFSTKNRQPFLRDKDMRTRLHAQLGGISKTLGCAPILTGGVEDHVHLLARFGRTITRPEWVKELKRVSNLWLKDEYKIRDFEWQGGYADFSVSESSRRGETIYRKSGRASSQSQLSG